MAQVTKIENGFSVTAYRGDAKTLLAFDLPKNRTVRLAGFTVRYTPQGGSSQYVQNNLQFEHPAQHAQDAAEPPNSTINAPLHKFRWVHVPGSVHQGLAPFFGRYAYTVTPRYFDEARSLLPLDTGLSVTVQVEVAPFEKGRLAVGFTRGYTQSQAFVHHFGLKARIQPDHAPLGFDTHQDAGVNAAGTHFTYEQEYEWLGSTARTRLLGLLDEVVGDKTLRADVFAYDLNEPGVVSRLLVLAGQGRARVVLDDAALHHDKGGTKSEDRFQAKFEAAAKGASALKRGKFGRYAHDKVVVVRRTSDGKATKVLTGSTNFSVTGLYVNSNHVLVFDDPKVAGTYAEVFDETWADDVRRPAYLRSSLASTSYRFGSAQVPATDITFSPHDTTYADTLLKAVAARIAKEGRKAKSTGSVLFAVMQIDKGQSPVYDALNTLHESDKVFSYGISDSPDGIALYPIGRKTGVLVTGKPVRTQLPPPFDQVPNISGVGHQVHHKFVVCGFNGTDPVVYCGSSNLAQGGEEQNGDNLLEIHDADVATVFAVEALLLVDHFDFLDALSTGGKPAKPPAGSKPQAAASRHWFLSTTDGWVAKYYDPADLHSVDRRLFSSPAA